MTTPFNQKQADYLSNKLTELLALQKRVNYFLYLNQSWKLRPSKQGLVDKLRQLDKDLPFQIDVYRAKIRDVYDCCEFELSLGSC